MSYLAVTHVSVCQPPATYGQACVSLCISMTYDTHGLLAYIHINYPLFPNCYYFVYRRVLIHSARILEVPPSPFGYHNGDPKSNLYVTTCKHRVIHKARQVNVSMLWGTLRLHLLLVVGHSITHGSTPWIPRLQPTDCLKSTWDAN